MDYVNLSECAEQCLALSHRPDISDQQRELFVLMANLWRRLEKRIQCREQPAPSWVTLH
jgi:hypothetical protein